MHSRRILDSACFHLFTLSLTIILLAGCETVPLFILGGSNASAARPDGGTSSAQIIDGSQGNAFETAQPTELPSLGEIVINGHLDARSDVDFYDLGPAAQGDRITIDVVGVNGFNTVAALFDENGSLIDANDDRSYYAGRFDPYLSQVIRSEHSTLYLGIAVSNGSGFSSSSGRYDQGDYTAWVRREIGAIVPAARQQVVYLNFKGGDLVQIGMEPIESMRPFSTEAISARLGGQTDYVIDLIVDKMRLDYAPFNVMLYDSRHDNPPFGEYSSLFFGNYNAAYLGLADSVDTGNAALRQEAIIYAEDFAMFEGLQPTAEEISQALANVAGHELGHLLGLEHTGEARDLMSTASTARQILEGDAGFFRARLNLTVFPQGWQDNPATLLVNVGANPLETLSQRVRTTDAPSVPPPSWRDNLPDIPIVPCARCSKEGGCY